MEDTAPALWENRITYLLEVSKFVTNSPCAKTLMSYYLKPCFNAGMKKDLNYLLLRCSHCNIPYRESAGTEYHVKPKKRRSRFQRRLVKKVDESNLTLYQYKCLKKLKAKKQIASSNTLEICCGTCKCVNKKLLPKPNKGNEAIEEAIISDTTPKQKKKKKKDRFSGLNVDAVLSVTPQRTLRQETKSVPSNTAKTQLVPRDVKKNTPQIAPVNKFAQSVTSNWSSSKKNSKVNKNKLKDALKQANKSTSSAANLKNFLSNF